MNDPLRPCVTILELNSRLFANAIAGIDEVDAHRRVTPQSNPLIFVACHLVDARAYLSSLTRAGFENPYQKEFDAAQGPDDLVAPPLPELRALFDEAGHALSARLHTLEATELAAHPETGFPVDDPSLTGAISFLLQHESYHLGQLALLRRQLGHDPMRYD